MNILSIEHFELQSGFLFFDLYIYIYIYIYMYMYINYIIIYTYNIYI